MKRYILFLYIFILSSTQAWAQTADKENPWEKVSVDVGGFLSSLDSSFRIGSGAGLDIDLENLLDLDATNSVFRVDASWRFTDNRKHRFDFTWFSFRRDGTRSITEDITIGDEGDLVLIPAGTGINGYFDLDIYQVSYSYSFLQDDRIDIAVGGGFYIMPMKFGLHVIDDPAGGGSENFTAPLPVLGFRVDIALTPKWFIRSGSQFFYVEYDQFRGSLIEFRGAVEYDPWKNFGIGIGFDSFGITVEAEGKDWPGIDLDGEIELKYTGVQLYFRYFL